MANLKAASRALGFERVFAFFPAGLRAKFTSVGLNACPVWAYLKTLEVTDPDDDDEQSRRRNHALALLQELGENEDDSLELVDLVLQLHDAACAEADEVTTRQGSVTDLAIVDDLPSLNKKGEDLAEQADLARVALASLVHLPQEWRGKRYRRTEGQATEHAREEGEKLE